MPVSEELKIIIKSVFDSKGFKNAKTALGRISAMGKRFGGLQAFGNVKALGDQSRELVRANGFLKSYGVQARRGIGYLTKLNTKEEASASSLKRVSEAIAGGKWDEFNKNLDKSNTAFSNTRKTVAKVLTPMQTLSQTYQKLGVAGVPKTAAGMTVVNSSLKKFGVEINQSTGGLQDFGNAGRLTMSRMVGLNKAVDAGAIDSQSKAILGSRKSMSKLGLATGHLRDQFKMHLLSVMFFGMQFQRIFQRMAMTTIDAFMKITEGSTEAGKAINMLKVGFETIKFTIGEAIAEALLPYIPIIMKIIDVVTEFVETHQKLVAGIVIGGLALGSFLFMFGQLGLGIQGLGTAFLKPFMNLIGKAFPSAAGKAMGAKGLAGISGGLGTLAILFAIVAALVVSFVIAFKENFGKIRGWVDWVVDGLKETFGGVFDILAGIVEVFVSLLQGDFDGVVEGIKKIFIGLGRVIIGVFKFIVGIIVSIGLAVFRGFLGIVDVLLIGLQKVLKFFGLMKDETKEFSILDTLNKVTGQDILTQAVQEKIPEAVGVKMPAQMEEGVNNLNMSLDGTADKLNIASKASESAFEIGNVEAYNEQLERGNEMLRQRESLLLALGKESGLDPNLIDELERYI